MAALTITTAEAAAYLGVSQSTVRVWVHRGKLVPVRGTEGRSLRFRLADVERLRASRMSAAEQDRHDTLVSVWESLP